MAIEFPVIMIGIQYVIGIPAVLTIGLIILLKLYVDIKRNAPEALVFAKARKKGLPVLCRTDIGSNYSQFLLGKKQKEGDIAFDDGDLPGLLVDPSLLGDSDAMRFGRGLDIYFYASTQWMPMTNINALGLKTMATVVNTRYKELTFLPKQEVAEFMMTKDSDIYEDCITCIRRYNPEALDWETGNKVIDQYGNSIKMTPDELRDSITSLREELKKTPIETGFYSFAAAFLMNPVSHLAQDLEQLKMLIEMMVRAEYDKIMKLMPYVIMFCMVIGAVGVVIYIIGTMVAK